MDFPGGSDGKASAYSAEDLGIAASLVNDLALPACRLHPEIADALASLRTAGVLGATVSGSGSSVFGLVESAARAEEVAESLRKKGLSAWAVHTL